jgi:hypothetical protein
MRHRIAAPRRCRTSHSHARIPELSSLGAEHSKGADRAWRFHQRSAGLGISVVSGRAFPRPGCYGSVLPTFVKRCNAGAQARQLHAGHWAEPRPLALNCFVANPGVRCSSPYPASRRSATPSGIAGRSSCKGHTPSPPGPRCVPRRSRCSCHCESLFPAHGLAPWWWLTRG